MRADENSSFKIKKTNISDMVCAKIRENIQKGIWKVGCRLPSESDLAEMFGVNRLTVRMAIQKLNALGALETRTGSGTYVVKFSFEDVINEISDFYMQPELLDDVSEFRMLLELECAFRAMERGTPEELDELERLVMAYGKQVVHCYTLGTLEAFKELARLDLDIHQHICKMSHNSLYSYSFSVAKESIYQYILIIVKQRLDYWKKHNVSIESIADPLADTHADLYRAIRDKNHEKCREVYTTMIDRHVNLMHR